MTSILRIFSKLTSLGFKVCEVVGGGEVDEDGEQDEERLRRGEDAWDECPLLDGRGAACLVLGGMVEGDDENEGEDEIEIIK